MIIHLLRYLLRLPPKIFKFLNLGILGIILSALFYDAFSFPHKEKVIILILSILALLLVFVVVVHIIQWVFLILSCHGKSILGKSCEYVCQFDGENGNLVTDVFFKLMNLSFSPQRLILHDAEGFVVETEFLPQYTLIGRSINPEGKLTPMFPSDKPELKILQDYASDFSIYQAEWPVLLDPPLLPHEKISFIRHSKDLNTEHRAFSDQGTVFMFRCRIPFRQLIITTVSPIGYRLYDITFSVDDDSGKKVPEKPFLREINFIGQRTLTWKIPFPGTNKRYKMAFKLKKLNHEA